MSDPKPGTTHLAVRLDDETVARIERVRQRMSGPAMKFGIVLSVSDAMRAALVAGLVVLEQEYGVEPGAATPPPLPDTRRGLGPQKRRVAERKPPRK
jgi:hypothetical protein